MPQFNWYKIIKSQISTVNTIDAPASSPVENTPIVPATTEQWEVWDHQSKQVVKQNLDAKRARRLADKWDSDYGAKRFVARQTHMPTASSKETGTPTVTPPIS